MSDELQSGALRKRMEAIVGRSGVLDRDDVPPSPWDTRQPFRGEFIVMPRKVAEVSQVLAACNAHHQPVVPMGGLTGLVQGCATCAGDLGLSLQRMDAIAEVDATAQTLTVEAGVTLGRAQQAASEAGLMLPVDIGARDNCMLGGNVSTNAGGTRVIRHGMMRDSLLGLEAVLADGTVISSMNRYLKNNSGYDLKHLFVGTEGTLGVITRLVLRLAVQPRSHNVALLAARSYDDVVAMLQTMRHELGAGLCGFEVMWRSFYEKATRPQGPQASPFDNPHPFYVLVEAMGRAAEADDPAFEGMLVALTDAGLAADGVVAKSAREREDIWAIRHEVEWLVTGAHNFDVSLRIVDAGGYVADLEARLHAEYPDAFLAAFGHLGDNNLHLSVLGGDAHRVQEHVYEALRPYSGAVSAEHGIGLEKRAWLPVSRSAEEIALMQTLKRTLDPNGILNPGKVVDV